MHRDRSEKKSKGQGKEKEEKSILHGFKGLKEDKKRGKVAKGPDSSEETVQDVTRAKFFQREKEDEEVALGRRVAKTASDVFLSAFGKNKKKKVAEFDIQEYSSAGQQNSVLKKVPQITIVEDIGNQIDEHFEYPIDQLKMYLTDAGNDIARASQKKKQKEEEEAKQKINKYLIVKPKSALEDDDFDNIDDNHIKALNNDVVFRDYKFNTDGQLPKKKFQNVPI